MSGGVDRYVLVSRWRIDAPLDDVWQMLVEPEHWPAWWRYVRRVELLGHGDADGVGAVRRIVWSSALGYGLTLTVTTRRVLKLCEIEASASGDVDGTGLWQIEADGAGTRVTYRWEVVLRKPWMRRLARLLRPLYAWNHHAVMRAGAEGLARRLARPLLACEASST